MKQISPTSKDLQGTEIFLSLLVNKTILSHQDFKVFLRNTQQNIKAKVTQSCFHRTDKEINKEKNMNIEYGNTQQQELKGGMAGEKGQSVESCRNSCEHYCLLISPSQKKRQNGRNLHYCSSPHHIQVLSVR